MARKFIVVWKDDKGNRILFPSRESLYDDEDEARAYQIGQFIFYIPFDLSPDGVIAVDVSGDGVADIKNVACNAGRLGSCVCIAGPMLDETDALATLPTPETDTHAS